MGFDDAEIKYEILTGRYVLCVDKKFLGRFDTYEEALWEFRSEYPSADLSLVKYNRGSVNN